jgi:cobalt-precorrin 5A hydrolase
MLAKKNGWRTKNLNSLAKISNRLINKKIVKIVTYKIIFDQLKDTKFLKFCDINSFNKDGKKLGKNRVVICPILKSKFLTLIPKIYLGIGCNRDTPLEQIEESVELFLEKYSLIVEDIKAIGSFEAKKDEVGLLEFAKKENLPIEFYNKDDINALQNEFSNSASTKFFGVKGVAEPSAILASEYRELIIKKEVYFKSITIAGAI